MQSSKDKTVEDISNDNIDLNGKGHSQDTLTTGDFLHKYHQLAESYQESDEGDEDLKSCNEFIFVIIEDSAVVIVVFKQHRSRVDCQFHIRNQVQPFFYKF